MTLFVVLFLSLFSFPYVPFPKENARESWIKWHPIHPNPTTSHKQKLKWKAKLQPEPITWNSMRAAFISHFKHEHVPNNMLISQLMKIQNQWKNWISYNIIAHSRLLHTDNPTTWEIKETENGSKADRKTKMYKENFVLKPKSYNRRLYPHLPTFSSLFWHAGIWGLISGTVLSSSAFAKN